MEINRSEESRRTGLAHSLGLIADYERDGLRIGAGNPGRPRPPEEVRRECDAYRREARRVWGFPDAADGRPAGIEP